MHAHFLSPLAPPLIACTLLTAPIRLLLQVGAMSADGSISARAIVTTELISEATELQGLGKVPYRTVPYRAVVVPW